MSERTGKSLVLVVDDASSNIRMLHNLLRDRHRVIFATTGDEALEQSASFLPDLILLDIVMPEMDGYEVCRRLKMNVITADIPVIFITGCSDAEDVVQGFTLGAADYVTKPFCTGELLARVETHLQLRQARQELNSKSGELEKLHADLKHALERNRLLAQEVDRLHLLVSDEI
jgi:PleD family two-component response regulator